MKKILIGLLLSFLLISSVLAYGVGGKESQYLHFDGKTVGPYDKMDNLVRLGNDKYSYTYSKGFHNDYININGVDYGPYNSVSKAVEFNNGYIYTFFKKTTESNGGKSYININGKITGPFSIRNGITKINNGFFIEYMDLGKRYVNLNGIIYGPYDNIEVMFDTWEKGLIYKVYLKYSENGKIYIIIDGKKYGPYDEIEDFRYGNIKYIKDDKAYINIQGKIYGPYDNGDEYFHIGPKILDFKTDKYSGFSYKKDDKYYININDKNFGPYEHISYNRDKNKGEGFVFNFTENGKTYINKNGKVYGPLEEVDLSGVSLNYLNAYEFTKKSGDCMSYIMNKCVRKQIYSYVSVNGNEYGPYLSIMELNSFGDNGYYFSYLKKGIGGGFINVNGKEYGPYRYIKLPGQFIEKLPTHIKLTTYNSEILIINENGLYKPKNEDLTYYPKFLNENLEVYSYNKGDKEYININGEDYLYTYFKILELGDNGYIYFFDKDGKSYVNINGEKYGPYENIEKNNIKILNDNYGFIFEKNGKKYLNINGKDYGPYNIESSITLIENLYTLTGFRVFNRNGNNTTVDLYYIDNSIHNNINQTNETKHKSNPKIDKVLVKFFSKIDKKGESNSKVIYESLIKKIDSLVKKSKSPKTKDLLNYIKDKVLEKIK